MNRITLITKPSTGYELLGSGGGEKLERFGDVVLARPDPQALWEKGLSHETWANAEGTYVREGGEGGLPAGRQGKWVGKLPQEWQIEFGGLQFLIKPTSFKHTGLFPEQLSNWEWIRALLARRQSSVPAQSVLNLFAYTGGATLVAAQAGAEVTHVDASKTAVAWARKNAALSGLSDKPIRWIVEDVLVFVKREIKRGARYDAIVMDPPAFGHGPKNELWKIEESFIELVELCQQLLSDKPLFMLINGYAEGYSPLAFAYNLASFKEKWGGEVECGDLTIEEKDSGRLLPAGIFARWHA
jgi:23S rRNA (cytosine1962-C5)-methyltransferase